MSEDKTGYGDSRDCVAPPPVPCEIIEVGQVTVQRGYRIAIKEVCENNGIEEGDILVIYAKKTGLVSISKKM